ncbi:MAG: sigma-70 family RNA polymerase sigma factor [Clostridia bacterium]|nr:sigma-70 family RNA polymerase sigma factor [Clostridia bacterium]
MRFAQGPCRDDAEKRLEALMNAYGTQLKRLCCLYLRDAALAEDAVQETFLKAWRAMGKFRGECSEKTWLTRIAVNVCRDMQRTAWFRRLDRRIVPEELPLTAPEPDDPALAEAIMALPARDREVILLRYYEQLPPEAIARLLRIPLNTVKSRLARAKKKLRQTLEGWCDDA